MDKIIDNIVAWFNKLLINWSHMDCYACLEDRGIATMGLCCGLYNGDKCTENLRYKCVDCPYLISDILKEYRMIHGDTWYPKIIATDFDGCLFTNKYPEIGDPIWLNINKLKEEQKAGSRIILWTNRCGKQLKKAVEKCNSYGIYFDAVNNNLQDVIVAFGGNPRKIFANEYWDDHAVLKSEKPIGEFSDGYHTFDDLYYQRRILSATLFNAYKGYAWKSWKHSDETPCFDGTWFIVGIDTPKGPYTYHYEGKYWNLFDCRELGKALKWDGHTSKDANRLLSLNSMPMNYTGNCDGCYYDRDHHCANPWECITANGVRTRYLPGRFKRPNMEYDKKREDVHE